MSEQPEIRTARDAASDPRIVAFGRFQGIANRLEYVLGRAIEEEFGITHVMYEVLLILGRAGGEGLPMRAISRAQVLTSGGVTRLVDRMESAGLVERIGDPQDRRARLLRLTPHGEQTLVRASQRHAENIERYFLGPLPAEQVPQFLDDVRRLARVAHEAMPPLA